MMRLDLQNVGVDFAVYQLAARSLKKTVFQQTVGGLIAKRPDNSKTVINALRDVNLTVNDGDRLALIGHNGAGKTTILRVMAGIYAPTQGRILRDGGAMPLFDVGLGIDDEASGYENIMLRGLTMGLNQKEIRAKTEEIADYTGLGDFLALPVRTYSSGMLLRLLFAIATCSEREIILMDEWLSAGDAEFEAKANARLEALIDRSRALVFASHSLDRLREICNRAALMVSGRVVAQGSVDEIADLYLHGNSHAETQPGEVEPQAV